MQEEFIQAVYECVGARRQEYSPLDYGSLAHDMALTPQQVPSATDHLMSSWAAAADKTKLMGHLRSREARNGLVRGTSQPVCKGSA